MDPSVGEQNDGNTYIGNVESAETSYGLTVFENSGKPRAPMKRKLEKNDNSEDIEGYKGPWAPFENEERSAKPSEVSNSSFVWGLSNL